MSMKNRDAILEEQGWMDAPGSRSGEKAISKSGSLVGYLIARHGTEDPALDDRDWELLSGWMGKGMPTGEHVER